MNQTLEYIIKKFNVDTTQPSPININVSRWSFIDCLRELDFKIGAEVGTEHGAYAQKLCAGNPQLTKLSCVDPYMAIPYYGGYKEQNEVNTFYEEAKRRLSGYPAAEIMKMTSMEAVKQFEPKSLDFVFIDGNHHFEYVVNDIIHWTRVVRPGGIVYGHDYSDQFHVREAVQAFMQVSKIKPWFIMHRGGKLIDSWMFVRSEEDAIFYS